MTDGLQFTNPDATNEFWNVLLYGPGGNGKTIGACSAPGPIVYINADGADALRKAHAMFGKKIRETVFTGPETLDQVYLYVTSEEGKDVKTVVLDPVGEIYEKLFECYHGDGAARKDALAAHSDVQTKLIRFINSFRDLPINLVLVCHEEVADQEGETIRRPMTGGKKLPEKIVGKMSIVGYCQVVPEDEEKGTPRRWVAQLVEARGRRAKDRSEGLGDSRDIDLEEWLPIATEAMKEGEHQSGSGEPEKETSPSPSKGGKDKGGEQK